MIKFAHIAPTKYLQKFTWLNGAHLILAHLVESDQEYCNHYYHMGKAGAYKIMDNSAFEMFKQGKPMYDSAKLIDMAHRCKAHCIVMSDYPRESWIKTMKSAVDTMDKIKEAGFDTFYVPQSELGDLKGYMSSLNWALNEQSIDVIGLSILGCPIALGIDEQMKASERNEAYKLQRFMSRWKIFNEMESRGYLKNPRALERFHCLGMVDGPNEVKLLRPYHQFIKSWDSSSAIWHGLHGIRFDQSPTGLINGKFEKEVDFSYNKEDADTSAALDNVNYIERMIR